jgi:hypothetical protein
MHEIQNECLNMFCYDIICHHMNKQKITPMLVFSQKYISNVNYNMLFFNHNKHDKCPHN